MSLKKVILVLVFLLLVLVNASAKETWKKEFALTENPALEIKLKHGGTLHINGWSEPKIAVVIRTKNSRLDDWDIQTEQQDNDVEIETRYKRGVPRPGELLHLDIKVPHHIRLEFKTMGGNITIKELQGNIEGKTSGGNLVLAHLKGVLDLKTMGGDILLEHSRVDGKVKTMGGRILVKHVVGDVKAVSASGNVIYEDVKSREEEQRGGKNDGAVRMSTRGGDVNLNEALHGAYLDTRNGHIHVKTAGEFVSAKTRNGNIAVDNIDGWVKAETRDGHIRVTMTGNPEKGKRDVTLTSWNGGATLYIPADLSMEIDIRVEKTADSREEYRIFSDFKLETEKVKAPGKDTPRRGKIQSPQVIRAKGNIAGGKHKIIIKTKNGHVHLKKNK